MITMNTGLIVSSYLPFGVYEFVDLLTHCGLVTTYCDIDLGLHWLGKAPSLNQCWLPIGVVLWHSPDNDFTASAQTTMLYNEFENCFFFNYLPISQGKWVKKTPWKATSCKFSLSVNHCTSNFDRIGLKQPGIILWMHPANERQCYIVTMSLIGWTHTQNGPWATCNMMKPLADKFSCSCAWRHTMSSLASD